MRHWIGGSRARLIGFLAIVLGIGGCARQAEEIMVYSARNEQLIKPIFDRYTAETGVPIRFVTDDAGPLIERLGAEGANSPADILLTVDAGELWHAASRGLLQAVDSQPLADAIPANLRDPKNRWFGLSVRARTIVFSSERVDPAELSTYAALADPRWRGKLCLRTSKKVYNQSLVAMLIAQHGEAKTEEIVRGWVANLATDVFSNDTLLMEAIAAGQCDVGIVNTYYFGRLLRDEPDLPVKLFWADRVWCARSSGVSASHASWCARMPRSASSAKSGSVARSRTSRRPAKTSRTIVPRGWSAYSSATARSVRRRTSAEARSPVKAISESLTVLLSGPSGDGGRRRRSLRRGVQGWTSRRGRR
jgi:iron(III) transport system substrate-binding protein